MLLQDIRLIQLVESYKQGRSAPMTMLFGKVKRWNILAMLLMIGGLSALTVHLRSSQTMEQRRDKYSRRLPKGGSVVVNDAPTRRFRGESLSHFKTFIHWSKQQIIYGMSPTILPVGHKLDSVRNFLHLD